MFYIPNQRLHFCTWSLLVLKVLAKPLKLIRTKRIFQNRVAFLHLVLAFFANFAKTQKNVRTKCKNARRCLQMCLVLANFTGFAKTFKISKDQVQKWSRWFGMSKHMVGFCASSLLILIVLQKLRCGRSQARKWIAGCYVRAKNVKIHCV